MGLTAFGPGPQPAGVLVLETLVTILNTKEDQTVLVRPITKRVWLTLPPKEREFQN